MIQEFYVKVLFSDFISTKLQPGISEIFKAEGHAKIRIVSTLVELVTILDNLGIFAITKLKFIRIQNSDAQCTT